MLRRATAITCLLAAPAIAGVQQQFGSLITSSSGSLAGLKDSAHSFALELDFDAGSSSFAPTIGAWTFSVLDGSGSTIFAAKGNGRRSTMAFQTVTYNNVTTRRYTMILSGAAQVSGALMASPTQFQFSFVAKPNDLGGFESFGQSLGYDANTTLGNLTLVSNVPGSYGAAATTGFSIVPAPGAAATAALAGLSFTRRRRQAA